MKIIKHYFILVLSLLFSSGCDEYRLGDDTYTCSCECVVLGAGHFYGDLVTCANSDGQAAENCRILCDRECRQDGGNEGYSRGEDLVAAESANAQFVGYANSSSRLRIRNTVEGIEATTNIRGNLSFYGGDCPHESCEIRMEYAALNAMPFNLGSNSIEGLRILNNGIWYGTIDTSGLFTFEGLNSVIVNGLIDGRYNSLTANATERGITGELLGLEFLESTKDGSYPFIASRDVDMFDEIVFNYADFNFAGTFTHEEYEVELFISITLNEGAPYAKAIQYYNDDDQLVLDASKSCLYKCQWGYCERRPGVYNIEVPDDGYTDAEPRIVAVTQATGGLDIYWFDADSILLGTEIAIQLTERPAYPVTLYVFEGSGENRRFDTYVLQTPILLPPNMMMVTAFLFTFIIVTVIVLYLRPKNIYK